MSRETDKKLISEIPKEKIADYIFMHLRNMWAVDGLYYLGIEEKMGTDTATEIDRKVWEVMGKIEARRIKNLFDIKGNDIPSMIKGLSYSGWTLDLEDKEIIIEKEKAILRNVKCRVQNTRLKKGLKEFGCKPAPCDNYFFDPTENDQLVLYWERHNLPTNMQIEFGASFPKEYVNYYNVVEEFPFWIPILVFEIIILIFVAIVIVVLRRRRLAYEAPKLGVEALGPKRGLTAVEAAMVSGLKPMKILTMILFGLLLKRIVENPLSIKSS